MHYLVCSLIMNQEICILHQCYISFRARYPFLNKPMTSMSVSEGRPPSLSNQLVSEVVCKYFSFNQVIQDSVKSLPGYEDRNYYFQGQLSSEDYSEFILKVSNRVYTSFEMIREINAVMNHINSSGFNFSAPSALITKDGSDCIQLAHDELSGTSVNREYSSQGQEIGDCSGQDHTPAGTKTETVRYFVRIFKSIAGELFDNVEKKFLTPTLLHEVGEMVGNIDKKLKVSKLCIGIHR